MTYHRVCSKRKTTGVKCGAYPFGTTEFTAGFSDVRVAQSLVFCVVFFADHCFSFCPFCGHCVVCPPVYSF